MTWQHTHNLKQTTWDRLNGVLDELRAARARLELPPSLPAREQAELQRVDEALSLVEAAVDVLKG